MPVSDATNVFIAESGQLLNDIGAVLATHTPGSVVTPAHLADFEALKARHANLKVMADGLSNPPTHERPAPLSPEQMAALTPEQNAVVARGETIRPEDIADPARQGGRTVADAAAKADAERKAAADKAKADAERAAAQREAAAAAARDKPNPALTPAP